MSRWISVKESLPDEGVWVLAWFEWNHGTQLHRLQIAEISAKHWRPEGGNGNFDSYVTHWMPLPAAPQPGVNTIDLGGAA